MKFERSDTKNDQLDILTALSSSVPTLNTSLKKKKTPTRCRTSSSPMTTLRHRVARPGYRSFFIPTSLGETGAGKCGRSKARHELSRNNDAKKYPTTRNNSPRPKISSDRSVFARSSSTDSWVCIHGCVDKQQVLTLYRPACTLYRSTSTLVKRVFTSEAGWRTEPPVCRPNAGKSSTVSREATGKYTST